MTMRTYYLLDGSHTGTGRCPAAESAKVPPELLNSTWLDRLGICPYAGNVI